MFGSYTRPDSSKLNSATGTVKVPLMSELEGKRMSGGMRRMLSVNPELLGLSTDEKCDILYEDGTIVNTDDDEVSSLLNNAT